MVVTAFYAANMVLELDMDTIVTRDDDMLEIEGTNDGLEKESVVNGEGKELKQVIILESESKCDVRGMPQRKRGRSKSSVWELFTDEPEPQHTKSEVCKICRVRVNHNKKSKATQTNFNKCKEGTGIVQGAQGGYGGRIFGRAQDDIAWSSGRGEMEL